jgi:hypothetical protein
MRKRADKPLRETYSLFTTHPKPAPTLADRTAERYAFLIDRFAPSARVWGNERRFAWRETQGLPVTEGMTRCAAVFQLWLASC